MDGNRFDALTRSLATSRRDLLKGGLGALAVAAMSAVGLGDTAAAQRCRGVGQICRKAGDCCEGLTCDPTPANTGRKVCTCPAGSTTCGAICCDAGSSCVDGACCPDQRACDEVCCDAGTTCVNGSCCPDRQACPNNCCAEGRVCFNGGCCNPRTSCPANSCGSAVSDGCGGTLDCTGNCPFWAQCIDDICVEDVNICVAGEERCGGPSTCGNGPFFCTCATGINGSTVCILGEYSGSQFCGSCADDAECASRTGDSNSVCLMYDINCTSCASTGRGACAAPCGS